MTAFTGHTLSIRHPEPVYHDWSKGVLRPVRGDYGVYIAEFANGIVKVGQTHDLMTRLSAIASNRRVQGNRMCRWWFLATGTADDNEQRLIAICHELGGATVGRTREWFTGISALAVIQAAEAAFDVPTDSRVQGA